VCQVARKLFFLRVIKYTDRMNPDTLVAAEAPEYVLTNADRCDRCGAQAYVSVLLETGELMFCGHDWTASKAVKIVDEREKLLSRD
jgi:hypothetical protein